MLFDVMLCGFFRMVCSMQVVTMCDVGMMPGLFMASAGIMLSRFFVMAGRMFMVLRRFCMMFSALLAHRGFEGEVQTDPRSSVFVFNTFDELLRIKITSAIRPVNNS
jgi:hypothetical protein